MPYIYIQFAREDRVERQGATGDHILGTVDNMTWDSNAGECYYIRWDGSPFARRYSGPEVTEFGITRADGARETRD